MSLDTDKQLKRILILLGLGFLAFCSTLYPVAKKAYHYMTSGEGNKIITNMHNVRKSLMAQYDHREIGVTSTGSGALYAVFVNSRFASLPDSIREQKALDIRETMEKSYSNPDELKEIMIVFMKYKRRFMRPAVKDSSASYQYKKNEQGIWRKIENVNPEKE